MQQRLSAIPDSAHLDSALSGTARLTQRVSFFSPLPELFTEKPRTNLILDFLEIQRSTGADFKNLVLNLLHSEIYAVQCTVYTGRYQLDSALSQTLLSLNLSIYSVFLAIQIGPGQTIRFRMAPDFQQFNMSTFKWFSAVRNDLSNRTTLIPLWNSKS